MFNIQINDGNPHLENTSVGNEHALRGWSQCLGHFRDEYERFMPAVGEKRTPLQPLSPSTAAGFVC